MKSESTIGICRLCKNKRELLNSHVWPQYLYKRYVSDIPAGGKFVDLSKGCEHSKQYTKRWFCSECEARLQTSEDAAARLVGKIEAAPDRAFPYDAKFLKYAVSISYRSLLLNVEEKKPTQQRHHSATLDTWRQFLLDKLVDVGQYTQHAFCIYKSDDEFHNGLGGQPYYDNDVVVTQVGSLLLVGMLSRKNMPLENIPILKQSQIHKDGGELAVIKNWHIGKNVTADIFKLLLNRFINAHKRSREFYGME